MMKKWTWAVVAISVVTLMLLFLPGCNRVREQIESLKPEIRETSLAWGNITAETTEILGTILVYNPNPISLPVKRINYNINMAGIDMGSGESPGFDIEKQTETPINVTARIDNSKIPAFWVEHLKNAEKSEASIDIRTVFDLKITEFTYPYNVKRPLETDILAPLNQTGPIPLQQKVDVPVVGEQTVFQAVLESISARWGAVTAESSEILLSARLRNDNIYPLIVPSMKYEAQTNGVVLASGESPVQFAGNPNSTGDINISVKLDNTVMDEWFVSHIRQDEKSSFKITVSLVFDIPTQGEITIPIWESSQEIITDILGKG